jgi:transcriptional regulator with XRE-family HTH domain
MPDNMPGITTDHPLERAPMATWNSPAVARRWLAHELRNRRDGAGLNQRQVGRACGWSGVKVSYIENAQQNVADEDLDKLLPLYEVPEPERPEYYAAADTSRDKGWWERYGDEVVPSFLSTFIGLEQGATRILTFEPTVVPGLLQTPAYVEEMVRADMVPRTPRFVRQTVDVREARREVLTRDVGPAEFVAVVDESVVRRVVGNPHVMAEQLAFILRFTERSNVRLHVFPFERGVSRGMQSVSHRILHFAGSVPPLVYMETRDQAQWIEDQAGVDAHDLAFGELLASSLDEEESRVMLRAAQEGFEASV